MMQTSQQPLSLLSPAKLNLFLHITGRRENGYHDLQTFFQLLNFGDLISFQTTTSTEITLTSNCEEINNEQNLIIKAAHLLQKHTKCYQGAIINLKKILPLGAGLGGGSSNAATTLLALNHLWKCQLNLTQLAAIGLELGADVPVFVTGRSAWGEGIGEILTPFKTPEHWFVVLSPACHSSTQEIFCHEQLTRSTSPIKIAAFPISGSKNDCEEVAKGLYPEIEKTLKWLEKFAESRMTGTGSSVFASFNSNQEAQKVIDCLPDDVNGFIAQGVNTSPLHLSLGLL